MNYTKGEWEVTQWSAKHGFNVFSENGFICSVPLGSPPHTMVETEANAQLIASAPDMYEALKEIAKLTPANFYKVSIKVVRNGTS